MPKGYITIRSRKVSVARKKATAFKRKYGYKPSIFKERNPNTKKVSYVIVRPKGIRKL